MPFWSKIGSRLVKIYPPVLLLAAYVAFAAGQVSAREWLVPGQAPTIQAAIDSCVTGDVVVLSPGVYSDCTNYSENVYHIAVLTPGVSLRGSTGDPADVILDAGFAGRCLEVRNAGAGVTIEGITFRRGQAVSPFGKGGAVFAIFSEPVFRSCVFDSNRADFGGAAISASYGSLTVEDCVFTDNSTQGIGAAVQVSRTPTTISGTTMVGSSGSSVHYATDSLTMSTSIILGGDGASISRNSTTDPVPDLDCNDFWDNGEDFPDFISALQDVDGNFSADPHFCNPILSDYHLYAISPCAEENSSGCGQIGAFAVACGFGAVTWTIQPDGSGDYPDIQGAVIASTAGDTISLAPGIFTGSGNRDIDLLGKALVISGSPEDPGLVTIDCQGTLAEPHRAFLFQNQETVFTELRNLTITGGEWPGDGGAIYCESSPLIENVVFDHNGAQRGGAIFVNGGDPVIRDCLFSENRGDQRAGGVALFGSQSTISNSLFVANWGYIGSAVFLPDSSSVVLEGCTISGNNSSLDKDALGVDGNSSLSLRNCLVTNNNRHAVRNYGQGTVDISGCNVFGNAEGDYDGPLAGRNGTSGNISADPLYCGAESRDFTLRADSPCTEYNAPNGVQMGVEGAGCDAPVLFTDVSTVLPSSLGPGGGVSIADFNADGHQDIMVAHDGSANGVMLGDGNLGFTPLTDPLLNMAVARTTTSAWADFDNDGDLDAFLGNSGLMNMLAENLQDHFALVADDDLAVQGQATGSSWTDFDGDGFLDLFMASLDSVSVLLRGDGSGAFMPVQDEPFTDLRGVAASAWADYDNDGDQDLYLVKFDEANLLLENEGTFSEVTAAPLNTSGTMSGAAWGDYDNDGYLDLFLARRYLANALWRNQGNGNFESKAAGPLTGEHPSRGGAWADWDNDGDLDLFVTNCGLPDQLLRNEGGGRFVDVQDQAFAGADSSVGAAWADLDEDGDLDLIISDRAGQTRVRRNDLSSGHNWLRLNLVGQNGQVGCTGARAKITMPGGSIQIREVGGGGGWLSSSEPTLHFGLGDADTVASLEVIWPGGTSRLEEQILANQVLSWLEPDTTQIETPVPDHPLGRMRLLPGRPNPFNPVTVLDFEVATPGKVILEIYDLGGRLIKRLADEHFEPGLYSRSWRGRDDRGRAMAAGVYLVRLRTGRSIATRSITLLK